MTNKQLKEEKTDPKVRFAELRSDERKLLASIKDKEKEIKVTLAQLQALRQLQAEVIDEMEIDSYEETLREETKEREEQIENLEEIVREVKEEVERKDGEQTLYTGLTAEKINIAANENTISRMYELAYTTNDWSDSEAKEFFQIREAVFQAKNYELADNLTTRVDNVYQVLQRVTAEKQDQIKANYKPAYTSNQQTTTPLPPLQNQFNATEFTKNYKNDKPVFKPLEEKTGLKFDKKKIL